MTISHVFLRRKFYATTPPSLTHNQALECKITRRQPDENASLSFAKLRRRREGLGVAAAFLVDSG